MNFRSVKVISLLILPIFASTAFADGNLPKVPEKFEINGHTAFLYAAPAPAQGKPWVWFAPTLKGLSLVLRKAYFEGFLRAGISIAGYDVGEVRGAPASSAQFTLFYEEMVKRGFSPKPILIGQSRGGLMMLGWGMRHPDKVQAFVGIYPVCNLATWGMKNLPVTLADYQMTEEELRARLAEFNPLDNLSRLAEHKVPMFIVQGDEDRAVPHDEHALLLQKRYEAAGGPITLRLIPGEGHKESPSFFANGELIEFVTRQAEARTP
jgi:pimeloyl-ACP methyl ester carboxylesterase